MDGGGNEASARPAARAFLERLGPLGLIGLIGLLRSIGPLGLIGPAAAAQSSAADPAAPAFVETAAERGFGYVGEAVRVRVRFGFEETFLAQRLIQPFRRALDVPAQLEAPWLADTAEFQGARVLAPEDAGAGATGEDGGRASVAVGDRVAPVARAGLLEREGARFRVFELERVFVPSAPGELQLDAPVLRFAHATRFEDDLLSGRAPVDRRDEEVAGAALVVPIRPLPPGAPAGFTGAVGRYTASASAAPLELELGASLRLELVLAAAEEGNGDLFGFAAPALELEDFHHRGHLERRDARGRRVIAYDLAPRSADVDRVPPLEIPFFDPVRGGWDAARTAEIPLRVHAAAGEDDRDPARSEADAGRDLPVGIGIGIGIVIVIGVVAVAALLLALGRARSARRG